MKYRKFLIILIISWFFVESNFLISGKSSERYLVRIRGSKEMLDALSKKNLDFASHNIKDYMDAILTDEEINHIIAEGYKVEILQKESDFIGTALDPKYHTYEETVQYLKEIEKFYPSLAKLYVIGYSTRFKYPIYALKISDNVEFEEEELSVLVDGMHHAREPLGNEVCLSFINYLLSKYALNQKVKKWVNNYEIWVIPILNPEGYKYIVDNNLSYPWWRKNLRDNNKNGKIDPDYDGVDLNRNYDINWTQGGSSNPSEWTYRGPYPFSEKETTAKRDLALRKKFVASVSYHSYGEVILYNWSWPGSGSRAPDHLLMKEIASEMAKRIKNEEGTGTYSYSLANGANQSLCWMYGVEGTLEFLVEVGTSFIPSGDKIKSLVDSNLKGLFYLLDRLSGPGIKLKVRDFYSGEPICANVSILEIDDFNYIIPRTTSPYTGIHTRLLQEGQYNIIISALGYETKKIKVEIGPQMKTLEVFLKKADWEKIGRIGQLLFLPSYIN